MTDTVPETSVPAGEEPAARCPRCERPFAGERARDLHVGEVHGDAMTDAEADAYERARDEEEEELFGFHMKVFVAIAVVQIVIVLVYMIAFGSGFA